MVDRIFEFALCQRVFVLMGALALIAAGVWSALRLPIDAVPDITNVQVQINTTVSALSPEEVERQVSFPIETEMTGLPGLEEVRSLSKFGLSQVTMVFSEQTDIYRARQLVSERLQMVLGELPAGAQPKLAPISTGLGEVFFYTLDYATNLPTAAGSRGAMAKVENPGALSPLTPALSPLRGEGDAPNVAGDPGTRRRVSTPVANAAKSDLIPEGVGRAPSPLNGERAGVRGEDSQRPNRTSTDSQNPKPENDQSLLTSAATKSRQEQLLELRTLHDTVVKPVFRSVPGVADIETCGG
jgi:Cu/Ag efflux pump CusA